MVVGDSVQVRRKNKIAVSVVWDVPGFAVGNDMPPWSDDRGSVSRRLWIFRFDRTVQHKDMNLEDFMRRHELAAIMLKANRAYHAFARFLQDHPALDITSYWPEYFNRNTEVFRQEINPVESFLASGNVSYDPDNYTTMEEFRKVWRLYCQTELGMATLPRWHEGMYLEPLRKRGIVYLRNAESREFPVGSNLMVKDRFLVGINVNASHTATASNFRPPDGPAPVSIRRQKSKAKPKSTARPKPRAREPAPCLLPPAPQSCSSSLRHSMSPDPLKSLYDEFQAVFPKDNVGGRTLCANRSVRNELASVVGHRFIEDARAYVETHKGGGAEGQVSDVIAWLEEAESIMRQVETPQ